MEIHVIFLYLAILLFSARLFGDIFYRFGIPSVLGEILVGIILGQSLFGIIPLSDAIRLLAELGIILLLFHIGLEADIHQLTKVGVYAFLVASVGAILPMAAGFLISYYLIKLSVITSLFIGGTLTATSIGITVRVLDDLGVMKERFAQIVLGAAVLDDIFGVIILSGLYEFSKEGSFHIDTTLRLGLYIGTFFILAPIIARLLARFLVFVSNRIGGEDFIPPTVLSLVFLFAFLAHKVGSPEILGSFTAGLALSRRFAVPFSAFLNVEERLTDKIEHSLRPLQWTLTPIFFVSVGLALNLKAIDFTLPRFWVLSGILLFVALLGKLIAGFMIRGSFREKLLTGLSMIPRGEVGLIFAEFGRLSRLFDEMLYAVMIFVVGLTTLVAPFLLKWVAGRRFHKGIPDY